MDRTSTVVSQSGLNAVCCLPDSAINWLLLLQLASKHEFNVLYKSLPFLYHLHLTSSRGAQANKFKRLSCSLQQWLQWLWVKHIVNSRKIIRSSFGDSDHFCHQNQWGHNFFSSFGQTPLPPTLDLGSSFRHPIATTKTSHKIVKRRTDGGAECTEDGRIGATEYAGRNGTQKCGTKWGNRERCGTYHNVGVKDLASAYVLCPRLAECGGLSIYGRNRGLRNNEGIVSGVMTQSRKQIRTGY